MKECSGKRFDSVRIVLKGKGGNYINKTDKNTEIVLKEKLMSILRCCRVQDTDRSQIPVNTESFELRTPYI